MFSSGFICLLVGWLVIRITEKLLRRFSQNSMETWHMGNRRNRYILTVIQVTLRYVTVKVRYGYG